MRIIFKILVILVYVIGHSQNEKKYIELNSFSSNDENFNDLENLDNYFINRKVIGIGESTHGTSEFTSMRHRIFKYLVKKHQFNTVFLEANFGACERINRYIHGDNDTIQKALDEVILFPWRTEEMLEFIEWMREYNEKEDIHKIEFVGIDMTLPVFNLIELKRSLIKTNSVYSDSISEYLKYTHFELINNLNKHTALINLLSKIQKESNDFKTDILITTINQGLGINLKDGIGKIGNYRDSLMAFNIFNYIKYEPKTKAIFFAHNGHVSKTNEKLDKFIEIKTTGWHLKYNLGEKYFSIAQDFNQGKFNAKNRKNKMKIVDLSPGKKNTLGTFLSGYNKEILFSLKNWIPENIELMHHIGSGYINARRSYKAEVNFYDAFIFINHTTETGLNYN